MKLLRIKTIITGVAAALMLSIGMFTTPAFADGFTHGHANYKGKSGHYLSHGKQLHFRGNRSRRHTNRHYQNRFRGHARHRSLALHKDRHYKGLRRHNIDRHHYKHNRGRSSHKNKDLVGAVAGGIILYHLGRELSRH